LRGVLGVTLKVDEAEEDSLCFNFYDINYIYKFPHPIAVICLILCDVSERFHLAKKPKRMFLNIRIVLMVGLGWKDVTMPEGVTPPQSQVIRHILNAGPLRAIEPRVEQWSGVAGQRYIYDGRINAAGERGLHAVQVDQAPEALQQALGNGTLRLNLITDTHMLRRGRGGLPRPSGGSTEEIFYIDQAGGVSRPNPLLAIPPEFLPDGFQGIRNQLPPYIPLSPASLDAIIHDLYQEAPRRFTTEQRLAE
jgi:hypothetical protein